MTTPEGSKEYPVEILSDDDTCRYKIWDPKTSKYVVRSHAHYWHWISDGRFLTNKLRCGTCGHVKESPEMAQKLRLPHSHTPGYKSQRTEQEP